jgi:hypothetical protein
MDISQLPLDVWFASNGGIFESLDYASQAAFIEAMRDKQPQVASALELSLADEFRQKAVEMLIAYRDYGAFRAINNDVHAPLMAKMRAAAAVDAALETTLRAKAEFDQSVVAARDDALARSPLRAAISDSAIGAAVAGYDLARLADGMFNMVMSRQSFVRSGPAFFQYRVGPDTNDDSNVEFHAKWPGTQWKMQPRAATRALELTMHHMQLGWLCGVLSTIDPLGALAERAAKIGTPAAQELLELTRSALDGANHSSDSAANKMAEKIPAVVDSGDADDAGADDAVNAGAEYYYACLTVAKTHTAEGRTKVAERPLFERVLKLLNHLRDVRLQRERNSDTAHCEDAYLGSRVRVSLGSKLIAAHCEDAYLGSRVRVSLGSKLIAARMMQWVMAPVVDDLFPFGDDTARGLAEIWTRPGLLYC